MMFLPSPSDVINIIYHKGLTSTKETLHKMWMYIWYYVSVVVFVIHVLIANTYSAGIVVETF